MPTIPNNFPTTYVMNIASMPPKTTRMIAVSLWDPPACALRVPVIIRAIITDKNVMGTYIEAGETMIAIIGIMAPDKKARPEA